MRDFKKMTVESLRELARKMLGPGHSRFKRRADLVRALEEAAAGKATHGAGAGEGEAAPRAPAGASGRRARAAGKAAGATGKAIPAAKGAGKGAGKAAREGARAAARAGRAAAEPAVERGRAAARATAGSGKEGGKEAKVAKAPAAVAGAAAGVAAAARSRRTGGPEGGPDPEGYFVARVRGEEAAREAPHPMAESGEAAAFVPYPEGVGEAAYDEGLGDLPWSYGDDALVGLPRDPRTLFLYWDHARETIARGFEGLEHPRAQLWILARSDGGWDRVRTIEVALESRSYYVHDLDAGRSYRGELHAVDPHGAERILGRSSNEVTLPRVGPSPVVDDRFLRIPWDTVLGRLLDRGHPGAPFSEEVRAMLARLSDWTRFSGPAWGGSAGGMGGRPFSPSSAPSAPSSPSSPFGSSATGER